MKHRMMTLLLCAALAMPCTMPAAAEAALPEWFPATFDEAQSLRNAHGRTYIAAPYVCNISHGFDSVQAADHFEYAADSDITAPVHQAVLPYERPQHGISDPIGGGFEMDFGAENPTDSYSLALFAMTPGQTLCFATKSDTYSFVCDADGKITETDLYGTTPDCRPEYNEFVAKHGAFSVQDNRIYFAGVTSGSTGCSIWYEHNGTGTLDVRTVNCADQYVQLYPVSGGSNPTVMVCTPTAPGIFCGTWTVGRYWDPEGEDYHQYTGYYQIDEALQIHEITEELFRLATSGDITADGQNSIADALLLNRFLRGEPDMTLGNWRAGDLDRDGRLTAADLSLLKHQLMAAAQIPALEDVMQMSDADALAALQRFSECEIIAAWGFYDETPSGLCGGTYSRGGQKLSVVCTAPDAPYPESVEILRAPAS